MTRFGFLSTYPPTRCGLATFTAALASTIPEHDDPDSRVVRVDDLVPAGVATPGARTRVIGELHPGSQSGRAVAARQLDESDVVIVQHEYGIYGGADGDEILDLLHRITAPTMVVLHTVLANPTAHQRWVLERVAGLATAVVAMTLTASDLLIKRHGVPASKVHVIPHGVPDLRSSASMLRDGRPTVLTWGLLGPGKGIEWGIRAMASLTDLEPRPRYRVLGQTHPKVVLDSGEAYRTSLLRLTAELGLTDDVEIDGHYRDAAELVEAVGGADVVLLPYDSRDQATSGVLAEAVAAGKPVVATGFPHAVELLAHGAGIIVGHERPHEIASAIRTILARPALAMEMTAHGLDETAETSWPAVAAQYRSLGARLRQIRAA